MKISFQGIDPAVLVHALYQGTQPLGMGILHNRPGLTLDEVRKDIAARESSDGVISFDYFYGRPLKVRLETRSSEFDPRLYDRDAGNGAAEAIVASLRAAS